MHLSIYPLNLFEVYCLLKIPKYSSYISSYQGLKELQYVDLLPDLQRITTCKDSKNYNMQNYNLICKEVQLEKR